MSPSGLRRGKVMEGMVTISAKERDRLKVIEAVVERRLLQGEAALRLRLSVRQVKRQVRAYRHTGAAGLVSRRRGQPSYRSIADAEREAVLACMRERYRDFGPTLAAEYPKSFHGFNRSVETLRQWMIGEHLWVARRARRQRPFQLRERRAVMGRTGAHGRQPPCVAGTTRPALHPSGVQRRRQRAAAVHALRAHRDRPGLPAGTARLCGPLRAHGDSRIRYFDGADRWTFID